MRWLPIAAVLLLAGCGSAPKEVPDAAVPPPAAKPAKPHLDPVPLPFSWWRFIAI